MQMIVVSGAVLMCSATCGLVLIAYGVPLRGASLFGLGLAGFGATLAGVAAVCAQLFVVRRRAVGVASGVLAAAYFVRMIGNSSDARGWLRWFTPYGWMDDLQP